MWLDIIGNELLNMCHIVIIIIPGREIIVFGE